VQFFRLGDESIERIARLHCAHVGFALRRIVYFRCVSFSCWRALAETMRCADWKADAVIDLATRESVDLVQRGQWRYSERTLEVDFKAAGPDKQPTGKTTKTYDSRARRHR